VALLRVEIQIDGELTEPRAVLHVPALTPEVNALVELLECASSAARLLTVKQDDKAYVVEPGQIELVRTEGGRVFLYDRAGQRYALDKPLHEVLQRLGSDFARISKSTIVNIRRIDHVSPSFNGTMDIIMKSGISDYISRNFLKDFKKRLGF
jgi:DNA-binding LytR/AlgR family response regulator